MNPQEALSIVGARQEEAFEGIDKTTGWETAGADLREAFTTVRHAHEGMGDKNPRIRAKAEAALARADAVFGRVREKLASAIREGKMTEPGAVVPWEGKNGAKYFYHLNEARGARDASETFLAMRRTANDNHAALERLFGEKGKSEFWRTFEDRALALRAREEERRMVREAKDRAEFSRKGLRLITLTTINGERLTGGIKLRRAQKKENISEWTVVETAKFSPDLLKKGDIFRVEYVKLKTGNWESRLTNLPPRLKPSEDAILSVISSEHYLEIERQPKPKMVVEPDIEEESVTEAA